MNMGAVLEWVKANVFIVVFLLLLLAAPIAMFFVSRGMNAEVRKDVEIRARKQGDLAKIEKVDIVLPDGTSIQNVANEKLIARYTEVADIMRKDADAVEKAALEHNRKGRGVVLPQALPEIAENVRDVIPRRFHDALVEAYGNLLTDIKAGMPPSLETLRQELELERTRFITADLRKDTSDKLSPDELKQLTERLTNLRMSRYADAAKNVGLYVSTAELRVPAWSQEHQPSQGEMFNWQWQFWVTQDILRALHEANKADQSVVNAPVKRVVGLNIIGLPKPSPDAQTQSVPGTDKMGAGGFSGGFGDANATPPAPPPADGEAAAAPAAAANPKAPVPHDFRSTMSGRITNPLYDVIDVELDVVVETARLPQVLDALAKYNFITVTEVHLQEIDPFDAAQGGYFYGAAPVCGAHLVLETIWLRSWTAPFMPRTVKQVLGVPIEPAPASAQNPATPST